jgi:hypothetical protein
VSKKGAGVRFSCMKIKGWLEGFQLVYEYAAADNIVVGSFFRMALWGRISMEACRQ